MKIYPPPPGNIYEGESRKVLENIVEDLYLICLVDNDFVAGLFFVYTRGEAGFFNRMLVYRELIKVNVLVQSANRMVVM